MRVRFTRPARGGRAPAVAVAAATVASILAAAFAPPAQAGDDPFGAHGARPGARPQAVVPRKEAQAEARCGEPRGVTLWSFPERPIEGAIVRFVAVSETPRDATLVVEGPRGTRLAQTSERRGGPPYSWMVEVPAGDPGAYRARLAVAGDASACAVSEVEALGPLPGPRPTNALWPIERVWDRETENLYSAWVEKLFDDPIDASPSWNSLHAVTRDARRNFLHGSLGLGEDSEGGLALEPDCADLPYFLRAYFAWKLRLPFVYSRCYSVAQGKAPVCAESKSNLEIAPPGRDTLSVLQKFFARSVADTAHSATGRTSAMDDRSDVYPIRIGPDTLRPGVVFIDPYGHVLVVARRVDQTRTTSGLLLAVDAQPDGTVARKRYWRGNFLFNVDDGGAAPGFKRFRPVMPNGDSVRALTNAELLAHPAYGDWSTQQYDGDADQFYDRVDAALSPHRRPPRQVLLEVVDFLEQQVLQRVSSVKGGEEYMQSHPGTMAMPAGAAIFQTVGAWEDYATPSRDLRLLVALDVARAFPDTVLRRPDRFLLERGRSLQHVRLDLENMLEEEMEKRSFQYLRSDGTPWTLRLSELLGRLENLEMGYNPNDCVETRWGAPADSIEAMPCRRRAPAEQRRLMEDAREWFHTRSRPST